MASTYKVQITKIQDSAEASPSNETIVFTQHIEDLNVQQLIRDINRTPRKRRSKKDSAAAA